MWMVEERMEKNVMEWKRDVCFLDAAEMCICGCVSEVPLVVADRHRVISRPRERLNGNAAARQRAQWLPLRVIPGSRGRPTTSRSQSARSARLRVDESDKTKPRQPDGLPAIDPDDNRLEFVGS
jgi:hypothetical protein